MRKYSKLLAIALCSAVVLSTAGCGASKSDSKKDTSSKVTSEKKDASDKEEAKDCASYVTLGDYSSISLKTSEIDEETATTIEHSIKGTGDYNKIKKGTVKKGDTVNIYYVGKVNGKTFEGGSCTKKTNPAGYDLELGSHAFIEGFEEGLIGKKIGGTYDVKVTFPNNYDRNSELAGKDAVFTVTINFKEVYPELSDKFVKKNFTDFKEGYDNTAKDYKKYVRNNVIKSKAWDVVFAASKVNDYPSSKMETMKKQRKAVIQYMATVNGYTLKDYLKAQNMTEEQFDQQVETTAQSDVAVQLVYGAIAEKENITVTDEQYKESLEQYLTNYNCETEEELNSTFEDYYGNSAKVMINEELLYNNVKDFLVKNVVEK